MTFTLTGSIVSGKNQIQISTRNGRIHKYPNKRFVLWRDSASAQITQQTYRQVFTGDIRMRVVYTPGDLIRRDLTGMLDALFHLLEHTGIVVNDHQIKAVHWRTEALARKAGKVQIELEGV